MFTLPNLVWIVDGICGTTDRNWKKIVWNNVFNNNNVRLLDFSHLFAEYASI